MLPPEYLRVLLAGARAEEIPFDVAWPQAVRRAARIGKNTGEWLVALACTREAWERSYAGQEPTAAEAGLASLADGHASPRDPLDGRRCAECDRWLPTDADPRALFCPAPAPCRRRFNYRIERGGSNPAKLTHAEKAARLPPAANLP